MPPQTKEVVMRKHAVILLALIACSSTVPASAWAKTRALIDRAVTVEATGTVTYPVVVTSTMPEAKLTGRLKAAGGSGNDIQVFVFRQLDFDNWKNGHTAPALFQTDKQTVTEIDLPLEPGSYVVVLSNQFSAFTPKNVSGALTLSWQDDPTVPSGSALKKLIAFKPVPKNAAQFDVPIKAGAGSGKVTFAHEAADALGPYTITVRRPQGATTLERVLGEFDTSWIEEAGTFDIDGDKVEDVFFVGGSGGSGASTRDLVVVSTTKLALVSLSLFQSHQATEAMAEATYSDNFTDSRFAAEQSFLERIKGAYAATEEEDVAGKEDDPQYIFYTWAKDNDAVENGPLTVRRYPGKPAEFGSINAELADGPITYTAYFKAGVIAYNSETNEHYALFHPKDMYAWPTVLKKLGPYLLIGTRGEGLAIVHTKKFTLRRVRPASASEVEKIEIVGSKIRLNGSVDIDAPAY